MLTSAHTNQNQLLATLPEDCLDGLRPHLQPVSLRLGDIIEKPEHPITHVLFPLTGIVSVIAGAEDYRVEVGIVGRDGMTGTSIVLGADRSPHESLVQVAGDALQIPAGQLRLELKAQPALSSHFLLYVRAFLLQAAQTAVANGRCTIAERLARWILMANDRLGGRDVPLTHEFLSLMLGVTRPGVTIALQTLEGTGVIGNTRGRITVVDRAKLEEIAAGIYSAPPLLQ